MSKLIKNFIVITCIATIFTTLIFFMPNVFARTALDDINTILQNRSDVYTNNQTGGFEKYSIAFHKPQLKLSTNYKFIYFYRSSCSHCQRFSPVLSRYSIDEKIAVQAFTFDGINSSYFPQSTQVSQNLVREYFAGSTIAVPALFVINTANLHVYPVASGELSYIELADRMDALIPKILKVDAEDAKERA